MKWIYKYGYLLFIFALLGCGSNSMDDKNVETIETINVVSTKASKISIEDVNFNFSIPLTKQEDKDVIVELSSFNLSVNGCNIDGNVSLLIQKKLLWIV